MHSHTEEFHRLCRALDIPPPHRTGKNHLPFNAALIADLLGVTVAVVRMWLNGSHPPPLWVLKSLRAHVLLKQAVDGAMLLRDAEVLFAYRRVEAMHPTVG